MKDKITKESLKEDVIGFDILVKIIPIAEKLNHDKYKASLDSAVYIRKESFENPDKYKASLKSAVYIRKESFENPDLIDKYFKKLSEAIKRGMKIKYNI